MKHRSKVISALMMVTQIGISMMVPIFLCVFLGNFLDKITNQGFFVILFLILGICAAFRNVTLLLRPFYQKDKEREDAALRYIENLKKEGREKSLTEGNKEDGSISKRK